MRVVLITEGTYPHVRGGVSVWVDQLIRGMADTSFEVVALTATGVDTPVWELPPNVEGVHQVGLWAASGAPGTSVLARGRRRRVPMLEAWEVVMAAALGVPIGPAELDAAWRVLLSAPGLSDALGHRDAVQVMLTVWRRAFVEGVLPASLSGLSVVEASTITQIAARWMLPLDVPLPAADLYHAVSNGLAALPALAAETRHGTPFALSEHGVYLRERLLSMPGETASPQVRHAALGLLRELVSLGYRRAAVMAPCNKYNRRWEQHLGADPARIVTAYNGVDPARFPAATAEPDVPTVSFVGRIDPIKDLFTLIAAFALVRARVPDARLRIFGDAAPQHRLYQDACRDLAAVSGVGDAVSFEGRIDDPSIGYHAGHIVALSSISEGFPYSVIEAMCCARPVVATDVGGVSEAVGEAGVVVPPRNPAALADAMVALLTDAERRRRTGHLARQRVLDHFTLDIAIDVLRTAYARTLDAVALPVAARGVIPEARTPHPVEVLQGVAS